MAIRDYYSFYFRNYLRSHRYLREIVAILVFHIFFFSFLYTEKPDDMIWSVFAVLGLLLNMVTVSSVFILEKGNSLYFPLVRPNGRKNFFVSKILLIISIDLFWIILFSLFYGLRFLEGNYFIYLPLRLFLMTFLLALSTFILSLAFTYKTWLVWIVMLLIVFGGIINKSALFPMYSFTQSYALLSFLLPPFQEIIYGAVTLEFPFWRNLFLVNGICQTGFYLWLNMRLIQKKDFI